MKSPHLPLLIEILTEELPALPFLKELPNILPKWQECAKKYNMESSPALYFTPRRIVLYEENCPTHTADSYIQSYGPPLSIAYIDGDINKGLSKAGESFYKKNVLDLNTPCETRMKDGKEVLYYAHTKSGVSVHEVLPQIIIEWLATLSFGKSMFWGALDESFIRPVRNILVLLGETPIHVHAFGLQSAARTLLHRDISFDFVPIYSSAMYFKTLEEGKVILHQDRRKAMICEQIEAIQSTHGINVEIDRALLNELVAITEYPRALFGDFDESFLRLPSEVIITSMKENQRYFATYKDSKLYHGFVLVSNSTSNDTASIIAGNQKVLKARLSDAVFFYDNDLRRGFEADKLDQILFVDGLGTLLDKSKREHAIALHLLESYASQCEMNLQEASQIMSQSVKYAKADLLTEMVYEFTDLQGIMGYYYAQSFGMHPLVCLSLKEQYLPIGEDSLLPSHILSALLALSIKLDNIFSLFSIEKIPSGSKDPFALRRAANGVIKIVQRFHLHFDLKDDIAALYRAGGYKPSDLTRIENFFIERLEGMLKINPSLVRCALNARVEDKKLRDINTLIAHITALSEFFEQSNKQALVSLFKRVANILESPDSVQSKDIHIDVSLLTLPQEQALYNALQSLQAQKFDSVKAHIAALFGLNDILQDFFNSVLVNDENLALRTNRQSLIWQVYEAFLYIGDIKEITL